MRKRIPSKEKNVRKVVPISLISITDKFKKEISKNLKTKYQDNLTDIVVLEVLMKSFNSLPEKEILKISLNKIPKKYKKT